MGEVAERAKLAGRRLTQWVENERRVVTYRELSREVGCHVNEAKNLLLEHYTAHPSLYPTYLLTGPLLPTSSLAQTALGGDTGPSLPSSSLAHLGNTQKVKIVDMDEMSEDERNSEPADEMDRLDDPDLQGNDRGAEDGLEGDVHLRGVKRDEGEVRAEVVERRGVVLVGKDGLEDKVALFKPGQVAVHIYALSPGPVNDPGQYLVSSDNARNHRDYHKPSVYGTITGEGFKPSEAAMKDGAMSWDKKEAKAASKPAAVVAAASSTAKEKEKEKLKPKQVEVKVKQEKQEPEPKALPKPPAKAERSVSGKKKRVIESDDEADEPEAGPSKPAGPSSSQRRADDAAAMEAMMSMDVDMDDEMDEGPSASPKAAERVAVKTEPGAKKKRKVKKSVSEINDKGYMVTKDVWVEEEYSGDDEPQPAHKPPQSMSRSASNSTDSSEKKPQVKPAPRPPPNKPAAGGGGAKRPGGQSTLQGFFKKK